MRTLTLMSVFLALATSVSAQSSSADLTTRLRQVLPAEVVEQVIATVSDARSRGLPCLVTEPGTRLPPLEYSPGQRPV